MQGFFLTHFVFQLSLEFPYHIAAEVIRQSRECGEVEGEAIVRTGRRIVQWRCVAYQNLSAVPKRSQIYKTKLVSTRPNAKLEMNQMKIEITFWQSKQRQAQRQAGQRAKSRALEQQALEEQRQINLKTRLEELVVLSEKRYRCQDDERGQFSCKKPNWFGNSVALSLKSFFCDFLCFDKLS